MNDKPIRFNQTTLEGNELDYIRDAVTPRPHVFWWAVHPACGKLFSMSGSKPG